MTEGKPPLTLQRRIENARLKLAREARLRSLVRQVRAQAQPLPGERPIVMFNASARLGGFSQNAAFALLAAWALQLAGAPVIHFACRGGMSRCVLGTNPDDHRQSPPCRVCITQSKKLYAAASVRWFDWRPDPNLAAALADLDIAQLAAFEYPIGNQQSAICIPLGALALPSLRWALRRHNLREDEPTRFLLREYIQSAYRVAVEFAAFLDQSDPAGVVLFNGLQFPEAAARWVAQRRGLRVITHEVGFQPFSAFFSEGDATAYPMRIPEDFELTPTQNARLEAYLSKRFRGDFTMAGITFWPQMSGLDAAFLQRAAQFEQIVPVFTNVVNDTSQVHAATVFAHMYAWLDLVLELIRAHPKTLFVMRAHPDEKRRGTRKHSREPVSDWVARNGVDRLPNVIFIDANEPLSSYELIRRSKFVIVYNSSIGLEAALLGVPVLCGGKARYTQYPTVFFPQTPAEYGQKAEELLAARYIAIPPEFQRNARRVLYWQLYRAALPLGDFVEAHPTPGYVQLKSFGWCDLLPENSPTLKVLVEGIVRGEPFLMPDHLANLQ